MANFRDVAQHAGVSLATASRVASGSASVRAGRETASNVRCATSLRGAGRDFTTGAIGLLVPELGNPIFPRSRKRWSAARRRPG